MKKCGDYAKRKMKIVFDGAEQKETVILYHHKPRKSGGGGRRRRSGGGKGSSGGGDGCLIPFMLFFLGLMFFLVLYIYH